MLTTTLALAAMVGASPSSFRDGRQILAELSADFDGDYENEIAVVERASDSKLRVVILDVTKNDDELIYTAIAQTSPVRADKVARLEARRLLGHRTPELLAVLEESSPDEALSHVSILSNVRGRLTEVFTHTFVLEKQPFGDVVAFGDARPRFEVIDVDEAPASEAIFEVVWVRDPQRLVLEDGEKPVTAVIGAFRQVFRYDEQAAKFAVQEELQHLDFVPAKTEWLVQTSVQVPKIWGTSQAFWATDGDLDTSWNVYRGSAVGASLTVTFRDNERTSLVRLVPGCARNVDNWVTHDRISAFTLEFSTGLRLSVDLDRLEDPTPGLKGAGVFPLDEGFGSQLLLLLDREQRAKWVRLTIDRIEASTAASRRQVAEACLSEISYH